MALAVVVAAAASACSSAPGEEPTPWASSPFRQTKAEHNALVLDCLSRAGFEVDYDPRSGGFNFPGLTSQDELGRAMDKSRECIAEVDPARLEHAPPLSDQQLAAMYDYTVAQADCMREAGYPVSEPPPEQVFIDSEAEWDPYIDLRERGISFTETDLFSCQWVEERPDFVDW